MCSSDIFLGLLAILFPPIAVWVKTGLCSADSLINILLCTLGFIPGLLHAWYIIAKYPDPDDTYEPLSQDAEGGGGSITYIIVQGPNGRQQRVAKPHPGASGSAGGARGYGTVPQVNVHQGQNGSWGVGGQQGGVVVGGGGGVSANANAEAGSSRRDENAVPPTYAEAVKGDNKVQTHD